MTNQYLSKFQIIGSSIKKINIKNDFIILENDEKLKREIEIAHSISSLDIIDDGNTIYGTILLNIKVKIALKKKKYNIDLSIEGGFKAPAEIGEENFRNMLQVNGITSLYSIARGFIQSTTSQTLASGSVMLPMFNVAAYSKDMNKEDE